MTNMVTVTQNVDGNGNTCIGHVEKYYGGVAQSCTDYYLEVASKCEGLSLSKVETVAPHAPSLNVSVYVEPDVIFESQVTDRSMKEHIQILKRTSFTKFNQQHSLVVLLADGGFGKTTAIDRKIQTLAKSEDTPWLALRMPAMQWSGLPAVDLVKETLKVDIEKKLSCSQSNAAALSREILRKIEAATAGAPAFLLFDAFDEVPIKQRPVVLAGVVEHLKVLRDKGVHFCAWFTSRPYAFSDSIGLNQLGFRTATLAELDERQQIELIEKYLFENQTIKVQIKKQVAEARKLDSQSGLAKLMEEPMLASYICLLAQKKAGIKTDQIGLPVTRVSLLDGVVRLLLEDWDSSHLREEAKEFSVLLNRGSESYSPLRNALQKIILEGGLYGSQPDENKNVGTGQTLSRAVLTEAVDYVMPDDLGVRAHKVVEWLCTRSHVLKQSDNGYEPHRQLKEFLAVCGLHSQNNRNHSSFLKAVLTKMRTSPADFMQFTELAIALVAEQANLDTAKEAIDSALRDFENQNRAATLSLDGTLEACITVAQALLLAAPRELQKTLLADGVLNDLRRRLLEIITQNKLSPLKRALAGDVLSSLGGDPRFSPVFYGLPTERFKDNLERQEPLAGFAKIPYTLNFAMHQGTTCDLAEFCIARYLTTEDQFAFFIRDDGYLNQDYWHKDGWKWLHTKEASDKREKKQPSPLFANRPVKDVCWYEALAYTKWLQNKLRKLNGYKNCLVSLPSDAQWERAARANVTSKYYDNRQYTWTNTRNDVVTNANLGSSVYRPRWVFAENDAVGANLQANIKGSGIERACTVGIFPASSIGLYDICGNVRQWQANVYDEKVETLNKNIFVKNEITLALRGGSWSTTADYARTSFHDWFRPENWSNDIGFRVVLSFE